MKLFLPLIFFINHLLVMRLWLMITSMVTYLYNYKRRSHDYTKLLIHKSALLRKGKSKMAVSKRIGDSRPPVTRWTVEKLSGEKISTCYQCEKCSIGCPMTFAMDIAPHQVMHSIQLGLTDEVISSDTIWVCASCETCTTRCPNGIDIAHVMDSLRQLSTQKGVKASQNQSPIFHKVFLSNVKTLGRMHELSMAVEFALKAGGIRGLFKQSGFGLKMLSKGKMKLVPDRLRAGKDIESVFREPEDKK